MDLLRRVGPERRQSGGDLGIGEELPRKLLVVGGDEPRLQLLQGMAEGVVADVVQEPGQAQDGALALPRPRQGPRPVE